MTASKREGKKRYFTVAQANATLPLIRAIVRDITELARDLDEREARLKRILEPSHQHGEEGQQFRRIDDAHQEELLQFRQDLERDEERMEEYRQELANLGVDLKDRQMGLIDFPCWMDNREVYLCWRLGEPEVAYWHEVDAGFAGRQKLMVNASPS